MGLINYTTYLGTGHPQELVDLLYEEIFDLHPGADEIDTLVVIKDIDVPEETDPSRARAFTILDYRVVRVDDEFMLDEKPTTVPEYAKVLDAWGRQRAQELGGDGYMYFHVHPEGFVFPSPKDMAINQALATVDYVREPFNGDPQLRRYQLGVILNRNFSLPLPMPDVPLPIADREIDLAVTRKIFEETVRQHNLPDDHPFITNFHKFYSLLERRYIARENDDEAEWNRINEEMIPLLDEQIQITKQLMLRQLPPEIAELMASIEKILPPNVTVSEISAQPSPAVFPPLDRPITPPTKADIESMIDDIIREETEDGRPPVPDAFDVPDIKWLD